MSALKVHLLQADLIWEKTDANLASFEELIAEISHTDLIVLPEMFSTGFTMDPKAIQEPVGGKTFKWMRMMAASKQAAIVGSYVVKAGQNFYNRLYFVRPDGSSEYYDKKHLFGLAGENTQYGAGTKKLIVTYKGWKICPMICYDLRFPVWSRSKATADSLYEYDLLVYVASWPSPRIQAWDTLLAARAIENISYSIGVNRIGVDENQKEYPGHSEVYDYLGTPIGTNEDSSIIQGVLDKDLLEKFRKKYTFQEDADSFDLH